MVNSKTFYESLLNIKVIQPIWKHILNIIENQIVDNKDKEYYLVLFTIYFALIDEGNITMSLTPCVLKDKWNIRLSSAKVLLIENDTYNEEEFESIVTTSTYCIDNYLLDINESTLPTLIGENKMFEVDDAYLYVKKYNVARKGIINSINRLFDNTNAFISDFDYKEYVYENFRLSKGQEKAIVEGIGKNLIITGGPGTGKTTSILFLLINLLSNASKHYEIYLIAPSGKASSRMKESIINGLVHLKKEFVETHQNVIDKINNLEESTIHRLLAVDPETNGFYYNKNHQFNENSIFIIDESSMIDVCLFNNLLEAIPSGAKVYIMGDKNQLPSVECGAVFGELLRKESLKENIVELDESIRFKKGTKIYDLAYKINNGLDLAINESDWKDFEEFEIKPLDDSKPIYYYLNNKEGYKQEQIIASVVTKWGNEFFKDLQLKASNVDDNDLTYLNDLFNYSEVSKILCAENLGPRGVKQINKFVARKFIDTSIPTSMLGYYPGMLMMINKNNKQLDLYNGDCGLLVTFKNDKTIYFMVKKASLLVKNEGKIDDQIFKLGSYTFYPLRLISKDEIDMSYAITIHKSQGSDYKNILVILPDKKGHPLLNRQIIYTAITRTKGNTYILSNQNRLVESKDFVIVRDTNIA